MKTLNVCLTIIPLRTAQNLNGECKPQLQNNSQCERASCSFLFKGEEGSRACTGNKPDSRRVATKGLWIIKA